MDIQLRKIATSEEYAEFVRKFATLLDEQLVDGEDRAKKQENLHDLAWQMPAIISAVNTLGYLRGQDGMFLGHRDNSDDQKEFYGYEDLFETRLNKLIDVMMSSAEKEYYQERLESYFVKSRTKQKPDVI